MVKEEREIISRNHKDGILIYGVLVDTKTPTVWREQRETYLVLERIGCKPKYSKKRYKQTKQGQKEFAEDFIKLHKWIRDKLDREGRK